MSLLEAILGQLGGGGGMPPSFDDRFAGMPMESQPAAMPMPPSFPGGVPTPRARPAMAPTDMSSADVVPPMPSAPMAPPMPIGGGGGFMDSIRGSVSPDMVRRLFAGMAGGLQNVGTQPFAGQAFANGMGGALGGVNKSDETQVSQGLKLKQINDLKSYRDDMSDARFGKLDIDERRAATDQAYKTGRLGVEKQKDETRLTLGTGRNAIGQQNADTRSRRVNQQGEYDDGRLEIGNRNATTAERRAATGERRAATGDRRVDQQGELIPGQKRKLETGAALDEARTTESQNKVSGSVDPSLRLKRADEEARLWRAGKSREMLEAKRNLANEPGLTPQERQRRNAEIDRKMEDLDAAYFERQRANRKAHGLNDDGSDARPARRGAAPAPAGPKTVIGAAPRDKAQREVGGRYTAPDGRTVEWTGEKWRVISE